MRPARRRQLAATLAASVLIAALAVARPPAPARGHLRRRRRRREPPGRGLRGPPASRPAADHGLARRAPLDRRCRMPRSRSPWVGRRTGSSEEIPAGLDRRLGRGRRPELQRGHLGRRRALGAHHLRPPDRAPHRRRHGHGRGPRHRPERRRQAAVNRPTVITRAGWGANESYSTNAGGYIRFAPSFNPVQKLIVHHTAGRNNDPNPAATIRAIFYDHAVLRGLRGHRLQLPHRRSGPGLRGPPRLDRSAPSDEPDGRGPRGQRRPRRARQALQRRDVGIVLLGNFTSVMPTTAARTSLVNLLAWKAERHGLDPEGRLDVRQPGPTARRST